VVLSEGETFAIDESWLDRKPVRRVTGRWRRRWPTVRRRLIEPRSETNAGVAGPAARR